MKKILLPILGFLAGIGLLIGAYAGADFIPPQPSSGTASTTNLIVSSLISGRVPYITTAGQFTSSSALTWNNTASRLTFTYASSTQLTTTGSTYLATTGGNVGIGTTSPYARFSIHAGATDTYNRTLFSVASSTAAYATSTLFTILAGGNVGIGTTSPYAKLSVVGQTVAEYFTVTSTTATSTFAGAIQIGTPTTTSAITLNDDKRIDFYSDDLWTYAGGFAADRIRFFNLTDTAKSAITFYDATTTTPVAVTAIITHDLLSVGNEHKHISIETVDDSFDSLDTRFECTYGEVAGSDEAYCGTASSHNLRVGSGGDFYIVDGNFKHNTLFDFFPNSLTNSSIALRIATTSTDAIDLFGIGTDNLRLADNVTVTGTGLFEGTSLGVDSSGTATIRADRAGTSNYVSFTLTTAGTDHWAIRMDNDTTSNLSFRDTSNSRTLLTLSKSTGNVGIGTTSPYARLSLHAGATDTYNRTLFSVASSTAAYATSTLFTILAGGNVGIGTTSPSSLFQTFSTATSTISIDSNSTSKGGCLEIRDMDAGGYTYCTALNGVLSCSQTSCK